jgi:hypothetical protein
MRKSCSGLRRTSTTGIAAAGGPLAAARTNASRVAAFAEARMSVSGMMAAIEGVSGDPVDGRVDNPC